MGKYVWKVLGGLVVVAILSLAVSGVAALQASSAAAAPSETATVPSTLTGIAPAKGKGGGRGICPPPIDRAALLAQELGISVDELRAAQERAEIAAVQQAVELGLVDEERADFRIATIKLRNSIDREALAAEALGMTVEELLAACNEGQKLRDLLEERGMKPADFGRALRSAFEAAVQQAVDDGVITQEQADQILEAAKKRRPHPRRGGPRRGGPHDGGHPPRQGGPGGP